MANKDRIVIFLVFFLLCLAAVAAEERARDYLVTGNWYPSSKSALDRMLDQYFGKAQAKKVPGKIVGLVAPHAGFVFSGQCAANAYKQLEKMPHINRVILLGVSHRGGFRGACVSDFTSNATPLGKIPLDTKITASLAKQKHFRVNNRIMQYEHSLENQLPFLQRALKNRPFKIVPILFGHLQPTDFAALAATIKKHIDEHTLVIASTDFTHYGANFGYTPFKKDIKNNLTKLDMGMIGRVLALDIDGYVRYMKETGITMCGFSPVGVLMKLFADGKHRGMLMDYYKSGDASGDYSFSVSYASILVTRGKNPGSASPATKEKAERSSNMALSQDEKKTLLAIARASLAEFLEKKQLLEGIENKYTLSEALKVETGVFVTLKIGGHLRGCIGSLVGNAPLYLGVRNNAIRAGISDHRFPQVQKSELEKIDMEISVMTPLQKTADYKKIRLGTDGVLIQKGRYQAVYLPQVATETGWGLDRFLSQLCLKAGLPAAAYKSPGMDFYIFQALVFGEKD